MQVKRTSHGFFVRNEKKNYSIALFKFSLDVYGFIFLQNSRQYALYTPHSIH